MVDSNSWLDTDSNSYCSMDNRSVDGHGVLFWYVTGDSAQNSICYLQRVETFFFLFFLLTIGQLKLIPISFISHHGRYSLALSSFSSHHYCSSNSLSSCCYIRASSATDFIWVCLCSRWRPVFVFMMTRWILLDSVENRIDSLREHFNDTRESIFSTVEDWTSIYNTLTSNHPALLVFRLFSACLGFFILVGIWRNWEFAIPIDVH